MTDQPEQQEELEGWPMPSDDVRRELEWRPPAWGDRPAETEPVALSPAA